MSAARRNRKDEILDTALALAFEGGPNRVTTVAIAERLGLTQPAIYRHFASKAELWAAITDRLGAEVSENVTQAQSGTDPALSRLRRLMLGHLELISRTPALPEIMLAREPDSDEAVVRITMQARMASFQKTLLEFCTQAQAEGDLRADIDPRDMAALIAGVLQSLVLRLLLGRNPDVLVEDGTRLLNLQLAAFGRQSEA
ncbi:TetR/AcrR family transcriptional regulator [Maritimibacter fusiformis]|uniref:TetR/AcrR family transcriptional regulator n=1 Tax=Maritimibacter fusiformis TaxID=2603819 RepID=A0A5D0RHT7_9RHOB|nr:TetR/AcrR family transcriptional regulator [Maritimibacter fusiformis]TYB80506.1 TetR/AcrR family transcriptional regulator [Maritimibacter fusiformis]